MKKLMLGNEAVARGAYEAGVRVCSAYPGTPSTEITEYMTQYDEVYAQWSPNEKVALEVAVGASIAGARAMACMKHVGLNVAADPLFTAAYTGVNGGLVVVVADDPGMHSSQNEQDSRFYALSAHIPMLEPADSQEAYDFMKRAFELSEQYDTPVLMRLTTRISHAQSVVEAGLRQEVPLKSYTRNMGKYVMMPAAARGRHVIVEQREIKLSQDANTFSVNHMEMNDLEIGIICSGLTYQYVKDALPNASVLKLGMVYPLPQEQIKAFAKQVKTLYVVEELEPYIETQVKALGLACHGKDLFSVQGELSATVIAEKIVGQKKDIAPQENLPIRPPVMCAGCPHRATFHLLNKLKVMVMGDIGCYTLGALPPFSAMDSCLCMGASVSMAHGAELALGHGTRPIVGVIGESTLLHSGLTALMDIVYNKGASTIIILDNGTTAMTGQQDNPSTGKNVKGQATYALNLEKICSALGVEHVRVVDPFNLSEYEQIIKEEIARREPSVIIAKRACVLVEKKAGAMHKVLSEKCTNCKMCLKIGCQAIEVIETGVRINPALCYGCGLCTKMCRFGAIVKEDE